MTVRAKLQVTKITKTTWGQTILNFSAIYDTMIPEDQRFQKATPSANFDITIDNPTALAQFELGKFYYIDFTPVEEV